MGFFDKAKRFLGLTDEEGDDDPTGASASSEATPAADAQRAPSRARGGRGRPARDLPPAASSGPSLDDALAAREGGDRATARRILAEIDKGSGLRTLLRAAAALEDADEDEARSLLPAIAAEEPAWRVPLQVAAALGDERGVPWLDVARAGGAPGWATAWAAALVGDAQGRRRGLVELLFADAALARTVAARDLSVPGAVVDAEAAQRYASFAHGRDTIRRFGAGAVAEALARARGERP
ncbi:MAG: hypothetical protein WKG00_29390 [Polyangiaceae bacterium]